MTDTVINRMVSVGTDQLSIEEGVYVSIALSGQSCLAVYISCICLLVPGFSSVLLMQTARYPTLLCL